MGQCSTSPALPQLQVRENARKLVLNVLQVVKKNFPYWNASGGRDHVFVFTSPQGACIDYLGGREVETETQERLLEAVRPAISLVHDGGIGVSPCFKADDIVVPRLLLSSLLTRLAGGGTAFPAEERYLLATFQGELGLEREDDVWRAIVLLYGPWDEQLVQPRVFPSGEACSEVGQPRCRDDACIARCQVSACSGYAGGHGWH